MPVDRGASDAFLMRSQQLLGAAITQTDAVVIIDAQGCITYLNARAAAQYEIEPAAALGLPLTDLYRYEWVHPGDEAASAHALDQEGWWRGENRHVLRSGRTLHVEATVSRVLDDRGQPHLIAFIRDMTAQKLVETVLAETQQWRELALYSAELGTWEADLLAGALRWDTRSRQIFGVAPDAAVSTAQGWDMIHPDDRDRARAAYAAAVDPDGEGLYQIEKRIVWPDGTVHWVASRGKALFTSVPGDPAPVRTPVRMVGIVMDIDDRKRTEQSLVETQQRFRLAVETAPLVIAHMDRELRYTWVHNPHPDFPPASVLGKSDDELEPFPDMAALKQIKQQVLATGQAQRTEFSLPLSDGPHTYDITISPLLDAAGQVAGLTSAALDVTPQRVAQAALQELNATLEARVAARTAELARSNAELDRFAYIASHDLRAPLRAISNLAKWIEEDAGSGLPDKAARYLVQLRGRVQRLEHLLEDLLQYSRIDRHLHAPEWVDAAAVVRGIVDLLSPPGGCRVVVEGELPVLRCERTPLETVLRNLIQNAIKHHTDPASAVVTVSAAAAPVPAAGGAEMVTFCVRDNGPGIAPEYHARIFELFQTLRPRDAVEGSGLGLAIVKKTVESMGGRIWVESAPGAGAAFFFTWPR